MNFARLISRTELSRENVRAGIITGVLVAIIGAIVLIYPRFLGTYLFQRSYDLPFLVRDYVLKEHFTITNVVVAFMDDDSHKQLQQSFMRGWDRKVHAKFLERMHADGAKAVFFDIVFEEEKPGEDEVFAAALRKMKNVVLAADRTRTAQNVHGSQYAIPSANLLEALIESDLEANVDMMVALQRYVGVDEVIPESDLAVRQQKRFQKADQFFPFAWAAATMAGAPITKDPDGWKKEFWINYYGPPRDAIPHISYWQAIDPSDAKISKPGFFKDKYVFVGSDLLTGFSGQRKDSYASAYPKKFKWNEEAGTGDYTNVELIPGVEVQATMFLNFLRSDFMMQVARMNQFWLIIIVGALSGFALMLLRPASAVLFGFCFALFITGLAVYSSMYRQLWFAWLIPVMQVSLATLGSVAYNSYRLAMHRSRLQQSIAMYVSPTVASEVLNSPDMMKPGAKREELSIIFTDIANFTNMTEGMDSETLAHLMNGYFEAAVNRAIHPTQGTVVKFIGDAIFGIWNAPLPQPNHRELACRAALLLRDQVTDFHFNNPDQKVVTRIGLHCGNASVGNFGSSNRVDYTAFGENVNLSSRMEGLNKYLGTRILATGDIIKPVEKQFTTRYLGEFQLKGFAKAVEVYELLGEMDQQAPTEALRTEFAAGLEAFRRRDFDAAELAFKKVLQMNPKDGPSKFYLSHLNEYRVSPPPDSWKGEIELKEK